MEKRFTGNMHMYTLYPRCNVLFSKFCAAVMRSCAEKTVHYYILYKSKISSQNGKRSSKNNEPEFPGTYPLCP